MNWTVKTMLGLGDAVYTYPIVRHYCLTRKVKVITPYPEVFQDLEVETSTNMDEQADVKPSYLMGRLSKKSQYEDMLESVKLPWVPFGFSWKSGFSDSFKASHLKRIVAMLILDGLQICVVKEPCLANMHQKNNDHSIVPDADEMQEWMKANEHRYVYVSVGRKEVFTRRLEGIDFDLNDQLSLSDYLTLCSMANAIITQVGHLVPIAQGLNRPLKIFYPKHIRDHRLKNIGPHKMQIPGVCNETI